MKNLDIRFNSAYIRVPGRFVFDLMNSNSGKGTIYLHTDGSSHWVDEDPWTTSRALYIDDLPSQCWLICIEEDAWGFSHIFTKGFSIK